MNVGSTFTHPDGRKIELFFIRNYDNGEVLYIIKEWDKYGSILDEEKYDNAYLAGEKYATRIKGFLDGLPGRLKMLDEMLTDKQ